MPNVSGSFSGKVSSQTQYSVGDLPNHELQAAAVTGTQRSPDREWDGSRLTYWGVADLRSGQGTQRGYYLNEHPDGERDWGTFEGTVTVSDGAATLQGSYAFAGGSGRFHGVTGGGTYRGRLVSPTEIAMEWAGTYQLAGGRASGAA